MDEAALKIGEALKKINAIACELELMGCKVAIITLKERNVSLIKITYPEAE